MIPSDRIRGPRWGASLARALVALRAFASAVGVALAVLVVCQVAPPDVAYAAPAEASGTVARIAIVGNRRIEDATVLSAIGLRRGDEITPQKVRRDLQAVFATGFFDDVRVESEAVEDGIKLTFFVVEKPAIRSVKLSGNKKIDEEDIREVIDIRSFAVLNDAKVKANVERIRDLYVEKGYYLADIEPVINFVADDQVEVEFVIQENRKVIVQRIDITGNDHVPASKIRKYMQTKQGGIAPWLTSTGAFRQETLDTDTYIVRQVFLEEGFVDVRVDPPNVYLSPDKRYIFISIHVEEGEQYNIGALNVEGDFVPEEGLTADAVTQIIGGRPVVEVQEDQWRAATGRGKELFGFEAKGPRLRQGDVFKLSTMQMVVQAVTDLYADQGYAFVNVIPLPDTDPERRVVDITFQIEKGEKVRIGRVEVTGNDPTFDKVVRREVVINEGDIYRGSRLRASRARLERLGYFEEVNISTPRGDGPDVLDVNFKVSEQPTGSFSLGMGFSSLEQFVFTANVSKNNFLGLGYIMSAAVNVSALRRQWNLRFFDPYFLDSRWTFRVDGYSVTQQFQLDEYQRGGSLAIGRYLDARDDLRLEMEYTFEDVGLTSLDPFREQMFGGDLFRNGFTSSLGLTFEIDKRNNRIFATKGIYGSLATELAGGFRLNEDDVLSLLGGEFNFIENRANFRFFQPLVNNDDTLVFKANSTLGWIISTDGRTIPFIHRYRAGGINSVRGYDWFSLGPSIRSVGWLPGSGGGGDDPIRGDDTLIVGGTETWVNNFELEASVVRAAGISAVAFFDAGNAFGDALGNGHLNPFELRTAVGAGIRWRSPIGPLRFEYGVPIRPDEGMRKSVFDFSIGSFF